MTSQHNAPKIHGAGMIGEALNLLGATIPRLFVITFALLVIGLFATHHLLDIQRGFAELGEQTAEAKRLELQAESLTQEIRGKQAATEQARQEIIKLDNQAAIAQQEADALRQKINGVSAAEAALVAEINDMESKQRAVAADIQAQSQKTTGDIPLATAQKRADISVAQAEFRKTLQGLCWQVPLYMKGIQVDLSVLSNSTGRIGEPCPGIEKDWTP